MISLSGDTYFPWPNSKQRCLHRAIVSRKLATNSKYKPILDSLTSVSNRALSYAKGLLYRSQTEIAATRKSIDINAYLT